METVKRFLMGLGCLIGVMFWGMVAYCYTYLLIFGK